MDLFPKIAPAASVSQVFRVSIFKIQVVESHGEWPVTQILEHHIKILCVCEALPGRYYLLTTTRSMSTRGNFLLKKSGKKRRITEISYPAHMKCNAKCNTQTYASKIWQN